MPSERPKIRWAPKLRQVLVMDLYQSNATGLVDEDPLDKVGFALLSRCVTLRMVLAGQVRCPLCGRVFVCGDPTTSPDAAIRCPQPGCTWLTTSREYHESWSKQDSPVHGALPAVDTFVERFTQAREPRERMLLIDQMLHAFHQDTKTDAPLRPLASDLIEGPHDEVIALLDKLSLNKPK